MHNPVSRPRLVLRPAAFWKLQYLCHAADTEVGGFALSSPTDLLVIEDILVVRQQTSVVTVAFDDQAVADLIDRLVDEGVAPNRCSRIWVHTHPGDSASPSLVDEQTFARSFGGCEWSVMLILAKGGAFYARLQQIGTLKTAIEIPVIVDYTGLPKWLDDHADRLADLITRWRWELDQLIEPVRPELVRFGMGLEMGLEIGPETGLEVGFYEGFGAGLDPDESRASLRLRFGAGESAWTDDEQEALALADLEIEWCHQQQEKEIHNDHSNNPGAFHTD